jgi:nucleoside-diphosphate-sugar epimerase
VGSAFISLALSRGHQLAGLYCPGESPPPALQAHPNLTWLRGTLAEAPWAEVSSFAPEACLHTAWITTPGVYFESPENHRFLEWSLGFLDHLKELGLQRAMVLGSCIEYQIGAEKLSEDSTPIAPTTTYARCKNALRVALQTEPRFQGLKTCWCRVFYPYGVGEHPTKLCTATIQKIAHGEKVLLRTPHSTKDYIFTDDLASGLMVVMEQRYQGVINIGTGAGVSVEHMARTIAGLMGRPELVEISGQTEADPFPFVVAENARLLGLGWSPRFTPAEGLRRLVTYLTA